MKYTALFFVILNGLILNQAIAEDTVGGCLTEPVTALDKSNEVLTSCDSARIAFKSNPKAENDYMKNLNLKLAALVATQAKQIMQELGASSNFYEQNNQSFLIGDSNEVSNSCKFDFIKQMEAKGCDGAKNSAEEKVKLKMVAEALGNNSNSLMEGILKVYGSNKYGNGYEDPKSNQCPLNDSGYSLNSQLTEMSANEILEIFLKDSNKDKQETTYNKYPQLAMIKEANKFTPGFQEKFEKYMKAFDPAKDKAQSYFSKFFFSKDNKNILGKGVAHRCEQVRASISSFVCHPLNKITTEDSKVSAKLFNGYDPEEEFQDQDEDVRNDKDAFKAYALLCEERASKIKEKGFKDVPAPSLNLTTASSVDCLKLKPQDDSIDNWYKCFNQGVRIEQSKATDNYNVKQFCERWSCKSEEVKSTKSCQAGGPLTSKDLADLNLKNDNILNQISYIQNLETQNATRAQYLADISSQSGGTDNTNAKKSLSDFDLNAFGGQAVMKFAGIPETPVAVAMISREMNNKGIVPSTPEQIRQVVNRGEDNYKVAASLPNQPYTYELPEAKTNVQANVVNNWKASGADYIDAPVKAAKVNPATTESSNKIDETKQMISDLEAIMKDQKKENSNAAEKAAVAPTTSANQPLGSSPFDSWANNLKNKEAALNDRENFANIRDADYWRRESDLRSRENELSSKIKDQTKAVASEKSTPATAARSIASVDGKKSAVKSNAEKAQEVSATSSGLILTPEKLDKLEKVDLKNFGVNIEEPFVISIRMNGKLIHVRVAKVAVKGKTFLAPRLNEDNVEVKEAVLKSPIFKEFRYFYEKENSAYFPTATKTSAGL